MKNCKKCNLKKTLDDFYNDKRNKDGKHNSCKLCMNIVTNAWLKTHPEVSKEKAKIQYIRKSKDPTWRKKNSDETARRKRPYLIHRGISCRRCKFIPEQICQLTVDHIDKNRTNNEISNLQTLCHNCHNLKSWTELREPEKLLLLNLIPSTST